MRRIFQIFYSPVFLVITVLSIVLANCAPSLRPDFAGDDLVRRESIALSVASGDYQVSILRSGTPAGQQVIFVHGTPGDATAWLNFLRNVPPGREYISIDRPGFGQTKPNQEMVSLDEQAAAVHAVMETRQGRKPVLVGHSLGGPVVAAVAANYPNDVDAIIEVAGSLDPSLEKIKFIQYIGELPPFVWLIPSALKHTNREIFALEDELVALEAKLDRITASTIIVHGTEDDLVPYANVPFMQRTFVNARHLETITIQDQNHFLPWNSEATIKGAIERIFNDFPGEPMVDLVLTPEDAGTTTAPWAGGPSGTNPLQPDDKD